MILPLDLPTNNRICTPVAESTTHAVHHILCCLGPSAPKPKPSTKGTTAQACPIGPGANHQGGGGGVSRSVARGKIRRKRAGGVVGSYIVECYYRFRFLVPSQYWP